MRTCPYNTNGILFHGILNIVFAYGGRENDLCLYDIEKEESIFTARNVPHDYLSLCVPIWVSDMQVGMILFLHYSFSQVALLHSN